MPARWVWWASEMQQGRDSSRRAACRSLAAAIGRRSLRGLPTAHGVDGETYYYPTQADREWDDTGAHAWAVYPHHEED